MGLFKQKKKCLIITHDIWTFAQEYVVNKKVGLDDDFDVCMNPSYEAAEGIEEELKRIVKNFTTGAYYKYDQAKFKEYDVIIRPMPLNNAPLISVYKQFTDAEYIYVDAGRTVYETDYFIKHVRGDERRIFAKSRVFLLRPNIYPPAESIFLEDVYKVAQSFMEDKVRLLPSDIEHLVITRPVYTDEKDFYREKIEDYIKKHTGNILIKKHNRDDIQYSLTSRWHNVYICPTEIPTQLLYRIYPQAVVYKGEDDFGGYEPSVLHTLDE